ncbi:MAG: type II secretion system F family protein [Actinomycetota bacterium]|nr:type II secretion system F family protein [Actinomycetota bacterium]
MTDTAVLTLGLGALFGALVLASSSLMRPTSQPTGVERSLAFINELRPRTTSATAHESFGDRVIAPAFSSLASLARRLTPHSAAARLQRQLDLAGNPEGWTLERVLGAKGVGLLIGALAGLAVLSNRGGVLLLVGPVLLAVFGFFLPDILVYNRGLKRQDELGRSLAEGLDLLTISVEAGLGFDAALAQVARNTAGPIAGEFFRVLQEMQIGKSRTESFAALAERTSVDELRTFVSALVQADRLGVPIAAVLREQSREMRLKRRQKAEETAQKVPVKILFPLMICVLPALFIVILGPGVIQIMQTFKGM